MGKNNMRERPLDGIRVIEIGQLLAGPFTGTILGYFGAEVIKIENPKSGDPIRKWHETKEGTSLWWSSLSRNKKCVTLDLSTPKGRKILKSLITKADILIENFRPGTLEKWGMGPEVLKGFNPGLILARISGYGQNGPYSTKPGFASVCEAFGGFRYVNGFPGQMPVRPNLSIGDTLAGIHAALGILLAYINREKEENKKSVGQVVDIAIFEAMFNMLEAVVPEYDGLGVVREPSGSTITGIAPTNTYKCKDKSLIVIGANTDSMFARLTKIMGQPELARDAKYANNKNRVENQKELDALIQSWVETMNPDTALKELDSANIAAGPIYSVKDMFADPQYLARELFETVSVNDDSLKIPAIVPRLSRTPGRTDFPGPDLGKFNKEIYGSLLGLDSQTLENLESEGVI